MNFSWAEFAKRFFFRESVLRRLFGTGRDSIVQEVARNVKNINEKRSSPGETKQKLSASERRIIITLHKFQSVLALDAMIRSHVEWLCVKSSGNEVRETVPRISRPFAPSKWATLACTLSRTWTDAMNEWMNASWAWQLPPSAKYLRF